MIIDIRQYPRFKEDLVAKMSSKSPIVSYTNWIDIDKILFDLYNYRIDPVTEDTIIGLVDMVEADAVMFKLKWS